MIKTKAMPPGYKGFPHNDLSPPVMIRLNLVIDIYINILMNRTW